MNEEYIELKLTKRACEDLVEVLAMKRKENVCIDFKPNFSEGDVIDSIGELLTTIGIESTKAQRKKLVGFVDAYRVIGFHNDKKNLEMLRK